MSSRNKQIILIALSILLVVLFLFMPEVPLETRKELQNKETTSESVPSSSMEERVQNAIQAVESDTPMAGIQDLLSIVREDSTQIDAQYYLGLFSIQTGQFEKAVSRFKKVITFAGLKKYPDVRYQLAVCLEELGKNEEALSELKTYLTEVNPSDSAKRTAVLKEIERLEIK